MTEAQASTLLFIAKCALWSWLLTGVAAVSVALGWTPVAIIAGLLAGLALVVAAMSNPGQFTTPPPTDPTE